MEAVGVGKRGRALRDPEREERERERPRDEQEREKIMQEALGDRRSHQDRQASSERADTTLPWDRAPGRQAKASNSPLPEAYHDLSQMRNQPACLTRIRSSAARYGPALSRDFARMNQPGTYGAAIARPALFRDYLAGQLEHLVRDYDVKLSAGRSTSEIPYPYVLDAGQLELGGISSTELSRWFPSSELVHIGDEVADGSWDYSTRDARPLALFDAPRTDFSLARLRHYTGTAPEHFQHFVLFTNYVRYVDEFVAFVVRRRDEGKLRGWRSIHVTDGDQPSSCL